MNWTFSSRSAARVLIRDADPTIAGNYDFAPNTGVIDFAVDTTEHAESAACQPADQWRRLDAGMGGVLMAIGTDALRRGAPQRVELNLLDAVLARVRALTQRRLLWLESLASAEDRTGPLGCLPDTLRVALLDLDSPER